MKKRLITWILLAMLSAMLLPAAVFAEEETEEAVESVVSEESEEGAETTAEEAEEAVVEEVIQDAAVTVESITFEKTKTGRYKVTWNLENAVDNMYVTLFLTTGANDKNGVELGKIRSGATGSLTVDIPDVDPGYYHFMTAVTTMTSDVVYGTSENVLTYENKERKAALTEVVVGRSDKAVYATYKEDVPCVIYIYDAATKELLSRTECKEKPASAELPKGSKDIIVGVAALSGKEAGNFKGITYKKKDLTKVSDPFQEDELTNEPIYALNSEAMEGEHRIFNNGQECDSTQLTLSEGENRILVFQNIKNGKAMASEKAVTLDTVAPVLTLEGTGTTIHTTKKKIFIQGYAEEGSLLTCGNEEVALVGNCFSIEKDLIYGTSKIRLAAIDKAGNTSVYQIEATRSPWSVNNKQLIVIAIIGVIGIIGEIYILFIAGRKRRKENENS